MRPEIYGFKDPVEIFHSFYAVHRQSNPRYSLRSWARSLGYETPSYLSDVMSRKKKASLKFTERVCRFEGIEGRERRYLELQVLIHNAVDDEQKQLYLELLKASFPDIESYNLELDQFRLIADWYHLVILEMTALEGFCEDYDQIAEQLGTPVTGEVAKCAIERLLRLKMLERNPDGKLQKTAKYAKIGRDVPDKAIRQHHTQMIEKAKDAVEGKAFEKRYFTGSTLAVKKDDLDRIEKLVADFHAQLHEFICDEGADTVYRVNTQVFDLL